MKKMNFLVAMTIALATAVVTSCGNKAPEGPVGTPIGDGLLLVDKNVGEDNKTVLLTDSAGVTKGEFASVDVEGNYLVGRKTDDGYELMSLAGESFATCADYARHTYYSTTGTASTEAYIWAEIADGNYLAFDATTHTKLIGVEGIKEAVLPLDNGYTLYKMNGLWGLAKSDAEKGSISDAKEITIITTTKDGKTYYWNGAKLLDETGKVVKRISAAQIRLLKKKGEKRWEEDGASAYTVKSI